MRARNWYFRVINFISSNDDENGNLGGDSDNQIFLKE